MNNQKGCHNTQADIYDSIVQLNLNGYIRENYFEILDRVIEASKIKEEMSVLDIGVGTGLLWERISVKLNIFGMDISEKMLNKIQQKRLPVQVIIGDFLNIPFLNNSFDRIISTFAFHHLTFEEKEQAFLEMDRVLKPCGIIVIGDFMFENEARKDDLLKKFSDEECTDMLKEFEDEYYTNIEETKKFLCPLGYKVDCEKGSTISWILKSVKLY